MNIIKFYMIAISIIIFINNIPCKKFYSNNKIYHGNINIYSITYSHAIAPDHFSNKIWLKLGHGDYYSPDHKYIAQFYNGYLDKDRQYKTPYCNLKILKVIKNENNNYISYQSVVNGDILSCVENCVWVPGQHHTLVIGTSSMYSSKARMLLWNGSTKIYNLKKGRKNMVECYDLVGASINGIIYYHYINYNSSEVTQEKSKRKIYKIYVSKSLLISR